MLFGYQKISKVAVNKKLYILQNQPAAQAAGADAS